MKASSRAALEQFKYQKYWAISMAPGSTGEARSHCLKNESSRFAPVIASLDGSARRGADTFVRRSRRPKNFEKVQVTEFGHSIEWVNEKGEQIDFGADTLREKAEKQAALIALAS